jgi:hypothetical protein
MAAVTIQVPDNYQYVVLLVHNTVAPYALDAFAAANGWSLAEHGPDKLAFFKETLEAYISSVTVNHFAEQNADEVLQAKRIEFAAMVAGKIGTL